MKAMAAELNMYQAQVIDDNLFDIVIRWMSTSMKSRD